MYIFAFITKSTISSIQPWGRTYGKFYEFISHIKPYWLSTHFYLLWDLRWTGWFGWIHENGYLIKVIKTSKPPLFYTFTARAYKVFGKVHLGRVVIDFLWERMFTGFVTEEKAEKVERDLGLLFSYIYFVYSTVLRSIEKSRGFELDNFWHIRIRQFATTNLSFSSFTLL